MWTYAVPVSQVTGYAASAGAAATPSSSSAQPRMNRILFMTSSSSQPSGARYSACTSNVNVPKSLHSPVFQ